VRTDHPNNHPDDHRLRQTVLRPGVHVLRRSASEVQVGLDPARAVVLPDRPPVRHLLDSLASPASTPQGAYDAEVLRLLADSGLLVDADTLLPLTPTAAGAARAGAARGGVAALALLAGDGTGALLRARGSRTVEVASCGAGEAAHVATRVAGLLAEAGGAARCLDHDEPPVTSGDGTVGVLVSVGEPPREHLDAWVRAQVPHLVVRLIEGEGLLGPFVLPGETACLRCVDAHHTDLDPAWPLLVAQHADAVKRGRADSLPEPVDPVLATLVGAWAAREVLTRLEGVHPAVTSSTLRLDARATCLSSQVWARHPDCGCGWA